MNVSFFTGKTQSIFMAIKFSKGKFSGAPVLHINFLNPLQLIILLELTRHCLHYKNIKKVSGNFLNQFLKLNQLIVLLVSLDVFKGITFL